MRTTLAGVFVCLCAVGTPLDAAHWYINPSSGNDGNSGSSSSPFRTIQKSFDVVQPGDTIHLQSGTYLQDAITRRSGTSSSRITVTGTSTAVVKGAGAARIIEVNHSFYTFDGFTIDGRHGPGGSASDYRDKLLYVQGKLARDPGGPAAIDSLKFTNMTFQNAGGECLRLRYFVKNSEVANSTFLTCGVIDFQFSGGGKNGEAIYIGTSNNQWADGKNPNANPDESTDNWVHHNTFDTQGNECVDIKEGATRNIVEDNECTGQRDTESAGFDSRGDGNVFRRNHSYGNAGAGVRIGGALVGSKQYGLNCEVYENNLTNNTYGAIKIMVCPQAKICGNTLSGNGSGTGACGAQYNYTAPCEPTPGCPTATAGGGWLNASFTTQTGTFTAEFDAKPSASPHDSLVGLSNGSASGFTSLATIVRFNTSGNIDARNGGSYQAASTIPFTANTTYHFRLVVNVASHTYSAYVTPPGQSERTIGANYAFRSEQAGVSQLNNRAIYVNASSGSLQVCNFVISSGPPPPTYVVVTPSASGVSASSDDGNVPGNTVDNSLSTRWSAQGDGQWIRYDLGTARTVGYVTIAVYNGSSRRNSFDLQVSSDGSSWTTVWSGQSSGTTTAQETYDFADLSARYVRYLGHGSNVSLWNSLTEVDIYALP